ncbi:MAG TPA: tRNA dihydrouridine(20/20a) synthase DusA, partial [Acinetobacter junii]|nr:tRNA dihydrouridine(20/20a) synthase DusA [Acinetobacter junii]
MTDLKQNTGISRLPRISVAPMMDWTTKDYRFFARLFNPNVILYTEMVTTGA